jgi:hypothetical protein
MSQNRNNKSRFQEEMNRRQNQQYQHQTSSLPHQSTLNNQNDQSRQRMARNNFSFDPQSTTNRPDVVHRAAQNQELHRRRNNSNGVGPIRVPPNLDDTADNGPGAEVPSTPNKTPKTPLTPRQPPVHKPDTPLLEKIARQNRAEAQMNALINETPESPLRTPKTPRSIPPNPNKEPSLLRTFRQQAAANYDTPNETIESNPVHDESLTYEVNYFRYP